MRTRELFELGIRMARAQHVFPCVRNELSREGGFSGRNELKKKLSFREAFLFIALWTVVFGVVFAGVILLTGTTQVLGGAFVKYRSQLLWLNCLFRS